MKQRNVIFFVFILFAISLAASSLSIIPTADAYCDARALDNFRCSSDWVQQEYIDYNCDIYWLNYDYCEDGCYDGQCANNPYPSCESGWLNSYTCDGKWSERLFRNENCDTYWKEWRYCDDGCLNGVCQITSCDVDVTSVSFRNNIREGESTTINAKIKNTGDTWETITVYIYFDNVLENVFTDDLRSGETITRTLTLRPKEGTHFVKIKAVSDCGKQDILTKEMNVYRRSYPNPPVCDYDGRCESWESSNCGDCDIEDDYYPYERTGVSIYPSRLDMKQYEGKVITISIDTAINQRFSINVRGVPADWLSYKKYVTIDNDDKVYVYVTPREIGLYDIDLEVRSLAEGKTFKESVSVYVSESKQDLSDGMPVTGMVSLSDSQVLVGVGIVILIVIIILGVIILRKDQI